jgi:hypothetical protein
MVPRMGKTIHGGLALACIAAFACACGPASRHDGNGGDGGSNTGDGGSGTNTNGDSCSSDLHSVLGSNGQVVETCPSNEGCEAGACVPACQAAAASQGSVGCDFVVATPSFYPGLSPPCFAVFLANNWPEAATLTIARGSASYDPTMYVRVPDGTPTTATWPALSATGIASEDVGVVFLSSDPAAENIGISMACPVATAVSQTGGAGIWTGNNAATGVGTAFHITTSVPVSAYDVMPYGGAESFLPSAELLLPTTAWGSNYVTAGPLSTNISGDTAGPGFGSIVAATDGTTVQITPTVALPGGTGVAAAPKSATTTYTLNAGEYIQWQDSGDMAGSVITSNNPVAYTGGTGYLCRKSKTSSGGGCDSGHQEIPPVSALGYEYVAPPYATRMASMAPESIVYRVVGTVAGTTLTYSTPITGAPPTLGVGQVVEFETTAAFTMTSQDAAHPFYLGQYMSGCMVNGGSRSGTGSTCPGGADCTCLGDEEYVNILPPAQWLSSYVFFTDPTYSTTNLVVMRQADANGQFADVTVDCLGTLAGWQPVGSGGQYEVTNADIQRVTAVGTCTNGRHTASSSGPFNIMVWGLDTFASYAYPAGGNVGKINQVVVIE